VVRIFARVLGGLAVLTLAAALGLGAWGLRAGYRVYVVHTGSMEPTLRPGDAVLDFGAPTKVEPGNLITFRASGPDAVVTHRVVSYADGVVQTRGDANASIDPWALPMHNVVGSVALVLPRAGYVLVYLRSAQGLGSLATALLALALLWQVFFPPRPLHGQHQRLVAHRDDVVGQRPRRNGSRDGDAEVVATALWDWRTHKWDRQTYPPTRGHGTLPTVRT